MSDPSIRTTIEELLAVEPAACDRDGLAGSFGSSERSWLAARGPGRHGELRVGHQRVIRGDAVRPRPAIGEGRSGPPMPGPRCAKRSPDSPMPSPTAACRRGMSTRSPTRPATSTTTPVSNSPTREAELLRLAATMTVSAFDRRCRDLARRLDRDEGEKRLDEMKRRSNVRRWIDRQTGMWQLHAELDPSAAPPSGQHSTRASARFAARRHGGHRARAPRRRRVRRRRDCPAPSIATCPSCASHGLPTLLAVSTSARSARRRTASSCHRRRSDGWRARRS